MVLFYLFKKNFLMFIYFWERQRQNASELRTETEGDTESKAGSRLRAASTEPEVGPKPMNREIVTWAETKSRTLNWLSHPGAPTLYYFFKVYLFLREREREHERGGGQRIRSGLLADSR